MSILFETSPYFQIRTPRETRIKNKIESHSRMFVLSQSRCCEASVAITSKVVEPLINNHYNPVNRQVDGALTRGVDCWCRAGRCSKDYC
ncbi:hypothetical protein HZ326_27677 [Fusarium oxysporum f. sp. albedinis]|nr:hypothetical protein HZ326_27677 [Fusarium oxysporum f. sp. albedinis]